MSIRIENTDAINFGTFLAAATVTHIRARRASDDGQPLVKALSTARAVAANEQFQLDAGELDFLYRNGDFTNEHYEELVDLYWGSSTDLTMEVDAMTSSTVAVAVGGYGQQAVSAWTKSTE